MQLAAMIIFAAAMAAGLVRPKMIRPRRVLLAPLSEILSLAGAIVLVVAGGLGLAGHRQLLALDVGIGAQQPALQVDQLSGLFLVISYSVAVPVLLAAASRPGGRRRLGAPIALVLLAVQIVLTADHLFVLLAGWELLGFAFYLLAGYDRHLAGRGRAATGAVVFSKMSGVALLLGGLLLAVPAHSLSIFDLGRGMGSAGASVGYALLLLGFGVKVGVVPVQIWLPPAYAYAPGAARAVMAGVSVNVGFYGMWRMLQVLGAPPVLLACLVLVLGGVTAILGIIHATVHADLGHLIAWSSVENAGLISAGFGMAMVGSIAGSRLLMAAGLLAATAQVCAHALGKSLLFISASVVEDACGTMNLDRLRGIAGRLPASGAGLVVGSLTMAGLPLTAGFASEWFTLEVLMQQFRVHNLALQLSTATAGVLVALTIGVSGIAFVRLVALTAFGHPGSELRLGGLNADRALPYRIGVGLLIMGCLGAAMVAPLEVRLIAHGLSPIVGSATSGALAGSWVLQPVFEKFSALSPTWLWLVIPGFVLAIGLGSVALSGRRLLRVRKVPPWSSGSPGVDRGVGYTSFGYPNPIRRVLAGLLLTKAELRREERELLGESAGHQSRVLGTALGYRVDVVEIVERYLYQPLFLIFRMLVRQAKRLQSGRLDAYLAYMLIALVVVVIVAVSHAQ